MKVFSALAFLLCALLLGCQSTEENEVDLHRIAFLLDEEERVEWRCPSDVESFSGQMSPVEEKGF